MNKFIKAACLLMVFSCLLQGCSKKKDNDIIDKTEKSSNSYSQSVDSSVEDEKTTVILNKPTEPSASEKATCSSNYYTTIESSSNSKNSVVTQSSASAPTYIKGILVVNKTYPLPSTYNPGVNSQAQNAFNRMASAASKDGINLFIVSGFRSYSTQETIYNNYVARDGKDEADRYSARPGHSEHQTGLAFDVNSLSQSFENTTEGKWLAENCSDYGFIIRFPKGKENVTGYMYEPWHIRYLGVSTAKAVQESGLTLEEYLGIDSVYSY